MIRALLRIRPQSGWIKEAFPFLHTLRFTVGVVDPCLPMRSGGVFVLDDGTVWHFDDGGDLGVDSVDPETVVIKEEGKLFTRGLWRPLLRYMRSLCLAVKIHRRIKLDSAGQLTGERGFKSMDSHAC